MASVMKDNEDEIDSTDEGPDDESPKGKSKPDKDEVRALAKAKQNGPRTGSFFSIYKKGQGYWTRMGTLIGVSVLGLMLAYTLYASIPNFFSNSSSAETQLQNEIQQLQREAGAVTPQGAPVLQPTQIAEKEAAIDAKRKTSAGLLAGRTRLGSRVAIGVAVGFIVVYFAIAFRLMNKPTNVDFLIATDSEMKKVNWTSRKELIGSSKVVILFMFFISLYLFLNDVFYGYLMYVIDVLKFPPPPFKGPPMP